MTVARSVAVGVLAMVVVFALLGWWAARQVSAADGVKEQCTVEGACVDQLTGPYVLSRTLP